MRVEVDRLGGDRRAYEVVDETLSAVHDVQVDAEVLCGLLLVLGRLSVTEVHAHRVDIAKTGLDQAE